MPTTPLLRAVAVNCRGGHLDGTGLARWLQSHHDGLTLFGLLSELDGPPQNPGRLYDALTRAGIRVFGDAHAATHGGREVAIAVLGDFTLAGHRMINLTPNTNPTGRGAFFHGHNGVGQDRWASAVWGLVDGVKVAVIATHAPLGVYGAGGRMRLNRQARNWRKARTKIRRLAGNLRAAGYTVQVLGGDYNEPRTAAFSGSLRWGRRHGFGSAYVTRVMWIQAGGAPIIGRSDPATFTVSDHPNAASITLARQEQA